MKDVLLHTRAGVCVWVASAAYYNRGRPLLAHRIDMTGRSPATHPSKRLSRGVVNGPETIVAETRGKREGYTCRLLSPELLIPSQRLYLPNFRLAQW